MKLSAVLSLVLAALLALVILSQGSSAPFEKDEESRPAAIIADIMDHGAWLLPADLDGQITRKPPLYYWLSAALLKAAGAPLSEAGARAVSIISGAILAALVMGVTTAFAGAAAGWLAWLFLLASYGFASHGAYARTDMLFTLLMFAAYCLLFQAVDGNPKPSRWIPAALLIGLAVLTKGPLAIVLCALGAAIYLLWTRRNPLALLLRAWPWLTVLIAIALAMAWYVPAFVLTRGSLFSVQMGQENIGHFLPRQFGGTGEAARPIYYILARFLGASVPLCFYLPALIVAAWSRRRVAAPVIYYLSFAIAVLGLFTIASAKRDDYIVPAFPPIAIALAWLFTVTAKDFKSASVLRNLASIVAAVGMIAAVAMAVVLAARPEMAAGIAPTLQSSDSGYFRLFLARIGAWPEFPYLIGIVASAVFALIALERRLPRAAGAGVGLASLIAVGLWIGVLRPGLTEQRTFKGFAAQLRVLAQGEPIYSQSYPGYEISFYYGRALLPLSALKTTSGDSDSRYLLLWSSSLARMGPSAAHWPVLLVSHPTSERRYLELLKIDLDSFERAQRGK